MTIVADQDEVLSSVALSAAVANIRDYVRRHPPADYHLAIALEALLAALQVYALRETQELLEGAENDEPDPVHAQVVIQ